MRTVARAVVMAVVCALLAACGAHPTETKVWAEPQLATPPQYRIGDGDPRGPSVVAAARDWVDQGKVPGEGTEWEAMSRWALIDIHQAMRGMSKGRAPAAGAAPYWGYFWPRDGAFIAVALDRAGHTYEARFLVDFLARLPFDPEHGFDARYQLNGKRVIDHPRGPQSDGCGWVLWALGSLSDESLTASANGLRSQCLTQVLRLTFSGWRLPPPSPDYWEVDVSQTSLGTVAPMLAGLRATANNAPAADRWVAAQAAIRLANTIHDTLGPSLQRFGDTGGMDAAIAMMMPPFAADDPRTTKRWIAYQGDALRTSGGLAPGADWKSDGTSWTPETALVAYTAAAVGRRATAEHWLDWLDDHRTPWGSLPEKVNRSGNPSGPAPLLWTAALVLLTLDELDQAEGKT